MAIDKIDVTKGITGVLPTANLGSGTASSSTILYGDQTYKTAPSGGLVLIEQEKSSGASTSSDIQFANVFTATYQMYRLIGFASAYDSNVILKLRYMDGTTADSSTEYRHLRSGDLIDSGDSISSSNSGNTSELSNIYLDTHS